MDAQGLERRGGGAAILGEAVAWLHFERGQNLPGLPSPSGPAGKEALRRHRTTHSPQPRLLGEAVDSDWKLQNEEVAGGEVGEGGLGPRRRRRLHPAFRSG